jgi:predicted RNase H-like HicB family nuclease
MVFKAFIYRDNGFVGETPSLGITVHGRNPAHVLALLKEETEEYLASLGSDPRSILALLGAHGEKAAPRQTGVMVVRYSIELEQEAAA